MSNVTVEITRVETENAFYCKFQSQNQCQPAYVELDCETGKLYAYVSGEIGNGVPMRVYHRLSVRWGIEALKTDAANALLEEIAPLAQRIVDGFDSGFDGHNIVGSFEKDAEEAEQEISDLCGQTSEYDRVKSWDAADWFAEQGRAAVTAEFGITAKTTDDELAAMVAKAESDIDSEYCDELTGTAEYFESLRSKCIDEASEE